MEQDSFQVVAHKVYGKENPALGILKPLFIIQNNKFLEARWEDICSTGRVFVSQHYDELDKRFGKFELFKTTVSKSMFSNEKSESSNASKYISNGKFAEFLQPTLLMQVIQSELPDCNNRIITIQNFRPSTKYIFVKTKKNGTFGPFEWAINPSTNLIELRIITATLPGPSLEYGQVYNLTDEQVEKNRFHAGGFEFLNNLSIAIQGASFFDYSSDLELVHYCALLATTFKVNALDKRDIKHLEMQAKSYGSKLINSRWERFSTIANEVVTNQEDVMAKIGEYLTSDFGKEIIHVLVEKNPDLYLKKEVERYKSRIIAETQTYALELSATAERVRKLNNDVSKANAQLADLRLEKLMLQPSARDMKARQMALVNDDIKSKKDELRKIEELIKQRQQYESKLGSLELIEKRTKEVQTEYQDALQSVSDIKRNIDELKREYAKTDTEIVQKIVNLSPIIKTINGYTGSVSKELPILRIDVKSPLESSITQQQQQVCITIERAMALKGRIVNKFDVLNLLICTQQSFITFLSGLPGAGKTSIARLLAQCQNITPRLKEVSVGRGWSSQKDLIGFYNPLTSSFQSSNTGLYEFLTALGSDDQDASNHAMSYILLDEANLSPIEHYWSSFLGMTDSDGNRSLTLGTDQLGVPRSLRFIATINHDGTTEPLSPRAIDRAPFIVMESGDLQIKDLSSVSEVANIFPLSSFEMDKLFGNAGKIPSFQKIEELTFKKIKEVLTSGDPNMGRPITISARKEQAIRQYCDKARDLMKIDGELVSFDYAVLQHILPLIRGTGVKFGKRLEALKVVFESQNLKLSYRYLERMINFGVSELHSYDFFCW